MGKNERRGWILVAVLLLIGLLCVILAGNLAIRFAPRWSVQADMRSRINLDGAYYTPQPSYILPPLDPAILTPPVWINIFLTPGQSVPTRPPKATSILGEITTEPTRLPPTIISTASPTQTLLSFTATQIFRPAATVTLKSTTSTPVVATQISSPTATGMLKPINTFTATFPPSNTPIPQADLQITKSNGVLVYSPGNTLIYTVVVTNNGPGIVRDALVSDPIQPQLADWSWACTSQNNGASGCNSAGPNSADFSDRVDLPNGASIVYTITANTRGDAWGSMNNTAFVNPPANMPDPIPGNNSSTDSDDYLNILPYDQIGTTPDGRHSSLAPGASLTFAFPQPLQVNGHPDWDLILYELPNGSGIAMDFIIVQIGDGSNWYTIFNWGNNVADTNSNMNIDVFGGKENDNRNFTTPPNSNYLYPFDSGTPEKPATGIVFQLDNFVPNGTYPYFRIISPVDGDIDGGCEIDAIEVLR